MLTRCLLQIAFYLPTCVHTWRALKPGVHKINLLCVSSSSLMADQSNEFPSRCRACCKQDTTREVAGKVEVRIQGSPASQEETSASQEETSASRRMLWIRQLHRVLQLLYWFLQAVGPGPRGSGLREGKGPGLQGGPRGGGHSPLRSVL